MQINNISNQHPNFGRLISGSGLKENLCPQKQILINNYNVIRHYIYKENLNKMPNADIILDYSKTDGFYGVIIDKLKKIPNSRQYFCKVNTSNSALENFKDWAINWSKKISC